MTFFCSLLSAKMKFLPHPSCCVSTVLVTVWYQRCYSDFMVTFKNTALSFLCGTNSDHGNGHRKPLLQNPYQSTFVDFLIEVFYLHLSDERYHHGGGILWKKMDFCFSLLNIETVVWSNGRRLNPQLSN